MMMKTTTIRSTILYFMVAIIQWIDESHAFNSASPTPPDWLVKTVVDWAAVKGLQMVAPPKGPSSNRDALQYIHLPVSLLPTTFPKEAFNNVIEAAPIFNELVDSISRNRPYLQESLEEVRGGILWPLFFSFDFSRFSFSLGYWKWVGGQKRSVH